MSLSTTGPSAIPAEILLEIFQQLLPHRLDEEGRLAFQVLRSVCSWWRSVAFSSPILWSSISLEASAQPNELSSQDCCFPVLEAWFARSGPTIPLELEYADNAAFSMHPANRASIKALIRRYQPQWKFLSLCVSPICFWDIVFEPPAYNWDNLNTVGLWLYDFIAVGAERVSRGFDALYKMPSLRCLVVEDHDVFKYTRHFGPINLEELHFTIDSFAIDQANIICGYQRLTKLTIITPLQHALRLSRDDHFALPSLLSFTYISCDFALLRHFTTPALANLEIEMSCGTSVHGDELLSGFLTRCTSALRSIAISIDAEEAFVAQPSAMEASLSEYSYQDWCPNLQYLTISVRSREGIELERLSELAFFLWRRNALKLTALARLTVRRFLGAVEFPYEWFQDIIVGELFVTVHV